MNQMAEADLKITLEKLEIGQWSHKPNFNIISKFPRLQEGSLKRFENSHSISRDFKGRMQQVIQCTIFLFFRTCRYCNLIATCLATSCATKNARPPRNHITANSGSAIAVRTPSFTASCHTLNRTTAVATAAAAACCARLAACCLPPASCAAATCPIARVCCRWALK